MTAIVTNMTNIPVISLPEPSGADKGGKGSKGGKKMAKSASKKGGVKKDKSTESLDFQPTSSTEEVCFLQVEMGDLEWSAGGANDDAANGYTSIADSEKVPLAKSLWGGAAELIPSSAGSDKGKGKGKGKGGKGKKNPKKGEAPSDAPPKSSEASMSLCLLPTPALRDCVKFRSLDVRLFMTRTTDKTVAVNNEDNINGNDNGGGEGDGDGDGNGGNVSEQKTDGGYIRRSESSTGISRTTSTSTLSRHESGESIRRDTVKTTFEVARGEIEISSILEKSSLDNFGTGSVTSKGLLLVNSEFVELEMARIKKISEEAKIENSLDSGGGDVSPTEDATSEDLDVPAFPPVHFDVAFSVNALKNFAGNYSTEKPVEKPISEE